jgi:hypothetical protein
MAAKRMAAKMAAEKKDDPEMKMGVGGQDDPKIKMAAKLAAKMAAEKKDDPEMKMGVGMQDNIVIKMMNKQNGIKEAGAATPEDKIWGAGVNQPETKAGRVETDYFMMMPVEMEMHESTIGLRRFSRKKTS